MRTRLNNEVIFDRVSMEAMMPGRKRNEVVGTGAAAELARRLRKLRDEKRLTLRELAAKSGYAQSSLSTAESGQRPPSWDLTQAFVQSCGEDPATWRQLWELAGERSAGTAVSPDDAKARPSPAASTDGAEAQPSTVIPADSAKAQPSTAIPADGAEAQPGTAVPADSTEAQSSTAVPAVSPEAQPSTAPSAETARAEGSQHLAPAVAHARAEARPEPAGPSPGSEEASTRPSRLAPLRIRGRSRRSFAIACALAIALIVSAVAAWASTGRSASARPRAEADTSARPSVVPEPVRRQGQLVLLPDQVTDLDSMAADWGVRNSPGTAQDDVWFSVADHGLHGIRNADIAILPPSSVGTFNDCALEQDYGVTLDAPHIRPGQLVCNITSDNRVALLRIVDVQYNDKGIPDQITFDAVVWIRLHKT